MTMKLSDKLADFVSGDFDARKILLKLSIAIVLSVLIYAVFLFSVPRTSYPIVVDIPFGSSTADITRLLEEKKVVRSGGILYLWLLAFHDASSIQAGVHTFTRPGSVRDVARMLVSARPQGESYALTFPEGFSIAKYAEIIATANPGLAGDFTKAAEGKEGYLYPDTYFVPIDYTAQELVMLMQDNFNAKVKSLEHESLSPYEVLILASIVEREANSEKSMRMVSSVLQNRLQIGMPLQADATLEYVLNKPLTELTEADLKIDSPYNTYSHNRLPPTPIGNPGSQSIDAVLNPEKTDYFYYITGSDGVFHYATTYNEHLSNVAKYLR